MDAELNEVRRISDAQLNMSLETAHAEQKVGLVSVTAKPQVG